MAYETFKNTTSVEICSEIVDVVVTEFENEVGIYLKDGAVLLGVANSPFPDDSHQFCFCIGWPKSKGDVPDWFKK